MPLNLHPVNNVNTSSVVTLAINKDQDDSSPEESQQIIRQNGMTNGNSEYISIDVLTNSSTPPEESTDTALLTILTSINNKCMPSSICTGIVADDLFSNHIITFINDNYEQLDAFPASEKGWNVTFIPALADDTIQYIVKQNTQNFETMKYRPSNVTYSPDCHGIIKAGQNRTCIISNDILFP